MVDALKAGMVNGLVRCDVTVPERWPEDMPDKPAMPPRDYFSEFCPLFQNKAVRLDQLSPTMREWMDDRNETVGESCLLDTNSSLHRRISAVSCNTRHSLQLQTLSFFCPRTTSRQLFFFTRRLEDVQTTWAGTGVWTESRQHPLGHAAAAVVPKARPRSEKSECPREEEKN